MNFIGIKNHPMYEINNVGMIRNAKTKAIKSQYVSSTGYYMVSLMVNGKSKPQRVHRLLAIEYIDNVRENERNCINHIDGDKLNNDLSNLEWCTHAENMHHAFKTGLANNTGENNGQAKLTKDKVLKIKTLLNEGVLSQYKIAAIYDVSRSCILGIKLGRLWSHV